MDQNALGTAPSPNYPDCDSATAAFDRATASGITLSGSLALATAGWLAAVTVRTTAKTAETAALSAAETATEACQDAIEFAAGFEEANLAADVAEGIACDAAFDLVVVATAATTWLATCTLAVTFTSYAKAALVLAVALNGVALLVIGIQEGIRCDKKPPDDATYVCNDDECKDTGNKGHFTKADCGNACGGPGPGKPCINPPGCSDHSSPPDCCPGYTCDMMVIGGFCRVQDPA